MTSPSAGIQQLLAAEKKAADKVGEARKSELRYYTLLYLLVQSSTRRFIVLLLIYLLSEAIKYFFLVTFFKKSPNKISLTEIKKIIIVM